MEGKYGRLFTEDDVKRMLNMAVLEGAPSPAEQIAGFDAQGLLTFPADEPLFLLRGQDKAAPEAISAAERVPLGYEGPIDYAERAVEAGALPPHIIAVERAARMMRDWQREHPERVKVPG